MKTVKFKVENLSLGDVKSAVEKKKVAHIKGFTMRLNEEVDIVSDMYNLIGKIDTISWDGDNYQDGSFTKYIVQYILKYYQHKVKLQILSFRYCYEKEVFLANWNNRVIEFSMDESVHLHNSYIADESSPESCDLVLHIKLVSMPDTGDRTDKKYFDLGNDALVATEASTVICIG